MQILVIPDLHAPFHCKKSVKSMLRCVKQMEVKQNFTHVVQVGDALDLYCFSRYSKSVDLTTPKKEIEQGRKVLSELWEEVQTICPKAKCYQLLGNHDARLEKQILTKMPELAELVDISTFWDFPGVKTMPSQREELIIHNIVFIHGHYGRPGQHLNFNLMNTALGHTHKGSVVFRRIKGKILWELNGACLADLSSVPLSYTAQRKLSNMQNGFGVIDDYGPRFIPLSEGKLWNK